MALDSLAKGLNRFLVMMFICQSIYDLAGGASAADSRRTPATGGPRPDFVVVVPFPGLLELENEVREHAAGHLVEQETGVYIQSLGIQSPSYL